MDYTYLDYFNYYLKQFLNELILKYPNIKGDILANYRSLLEGKENKNDLYVKYFYTKINEDLISIAKKDETIFDNTSKFFLQGIDFSELWSHKFTNDTNKLAIWKYLQLLMILGRKTIPNHDEIVELLKKVGNDIEVPAKVKKTLEEIEKEEQEENNSGGLDMSNLLNLAGGLSGGLGGGDGNLDIGNIVKNLSETLGDINLPKPENFASFNNDEGDADGEDNVQDNETNQASQSENVGNSTNNGNTKPNLFAELAEEMTETFDFSELEKDGNEPKNVGEALQKFMSGNNPNKLMNMVQKFGSKIQTDISSGRINQQDLLKETLGMMNNLQQGATNPDLLKKEAEKLIGNNPGLKNKFEQMSDRNKTKQRLQEKLKNRKIIHNNYYNF